MPDLWTAFPVELAPRLQKTVLNAGDELAIHSGGKGGIGMGSLQIAETERHQLPENIRAALEKILKKSDPGDSSTTSGPDS